MILTPHNPAAVDLVSPNGEKNAPNEETYQYAIPYENSYVDYTCLKKHSVLRPNRQIHTLMTFIQSAIINTVMDVLGLTHCTKACTLR